MLSGGQNTGNGVLNVSSDSMEEIEEEKNQRRKRKHQTEKITSSSILSESVPPQNNVAHAKKKSLKLKLSDFIGSQAAERNESVTLEAHSKSTNSSVRKENISKNDATATKSSNMVHNHNTSIESINFFKLNTFRKLVYFESKLCNEFLCSSGEIVAHNIYNNL